MYVDHNERLEPKCDTTEMIKVTDQKKAYVHNVCWDFNITRVSEAEHEAPERTRL